MERQVRNKRSKFVELAEKRVTRAIKDIRLIGNLSNRSAYEFADDDIKKIVRAIHRELETLKARFGDGGSASDIEFRLD